MLDLSNPFLQRALLAVALASVAAGVVGTLVVVRRIVFISGGLAHTAFGGVGLPRFLAFVLAGGTAGAALEPAVEQTLAVVCAAAFAVGGALIMAVVNRVAPDREDSVIGIIWAAGMSAGVMFIHVTPGYAPDIESYLFGQIMLVSTRDLLWMAATDVLLLALVLPLFRQLRATAFDPEFAAVTGVRVHALHTLLLVLVALTVVALMRVVGLILVVALLSMPAAIAGRFTTRMGTMMLAAAGVCALCGTAGLLLAMPMRWPGGATIVLVAAVAYAGTTAWQLAIRRGG